MSGRLEGKVAFISGAARGQGRSHAVRFAEEGADIVAWNICSQIESVGYPMSTPDDLAETVRLVEKLDRRVLAITADARDPSAVAGVWQQGSSEFGRCDSVLINHGIMPFFGVHSDTFEAWQDCHDVMLSGVYNTIRAAVPSMIESGKGGAIVITSSTAGIRPRTDFGAGSLGYATAKAALIGLMRLTALRLGKYSIRCNTVHPTGVKTPVILNDGFKQYLKTNKEYTDKLQNALPVQALDPRDVSKHDALSLFGRSSLRHRRDLLGRCRLRSVLAHNRPAGPGAPGRVWMGRPYRLWIWPIRPSISQFVSPETGRADHSLLHLPTRSCRPPRLSAETFPGGPTNAADRTLAVPPLRTEGGAGDVEMPYRCSRTADDLIF
jgi:NAD(P)-dependent dehydrogenase (short-subunit alcohol dehydrogenase family)